VPRTSTDELAADPAVAMLWHLLDGAARTPADQLPELIGGAAEHLGLKATVHLVDHDLAVLRPFLPRGATPAPHSPSTASAAWQALTTGRMTTNDHRPGSEDPRRTTCLPLVLGSQPLGVLELSPLPGRDVPPAAREEAALRRLATAVAQLIGLSAQVGDTIARLQGAHMRSVRAEIIWTLLPPLQYQCPGLELAGLVSPFYDSAGDAFDYAVDDGVARFLVVDASGHDLRSGMICTLAVSAYRKSRRAGDGLARIVATLDEVLSARAPRDAFVAGALGELDLRTGLLTYANAGQLAPFVLRNGQVVHCLDQGRLPALGLAGSLGISTPTTALPAVQLEPGDWVVYYTDGITESRSTDGTFFSVEWMVAELAAAAVEGNSLAQATRRLVKVVGDHQREGLGDDATVLLLRWTGPIDDAARPG